MNIKREEIEIELTPRQNAMALLYRKAYGRNIFWKKNGKVRLLNPAEIICMNYEQMH